MVRIEEFAVIIGAPGRGKSTSLLDIIKAKQSVGERTIVVVPDQSEKTWYPYYPVINAEDLDSKFDLKFKGVQIIEYEEKITFPFLYDLLKSGKLRDLNLVLDDPFYVEEGRPENQLMRIIKRRRQNKLDVFTTAHDFDNIPKAFFAYLTVFGLHYTSAPIKNRKDQVSYEIKKHKLEIDIQANVDRSNPEYYHKRFFRLDGTLL